jgi:hypothetical protein
MSPFEVKNAAEAGVDFTRDSGYTEYTGELSIHASRFPTDAVIDEARVRVTRAFYINLLRSKGVVPKWILA